MPPSDTPLLIINADDFGWNREATDLTVACFEEGRITSTTLLVQMEDSGRAARLGGERGIPTGLHLNLTDPLTAAEVAVPARERHARACALFAGGALRKRSWIYDPRVQGLVDDAIRDQLERFRELTGAEPTHVDGHNHVQVCPNVVRSRVLAGYKVRNAHWSWPSTHTAMARARALRRLLTARGLLTTRYFLDVSELHRLSGPELRARLGLSNGTSVEVMCHPGFDHELEALRSASWTAATAGLPLGSYRNLR